MRLSRLVVWAVVYLAATSALYCATYWLVYRRWPRW